MIIQSSIRRSREAREEEERIAAKKAKEDAEKIASGLVERRYKVEKYHHYYRNKDKVRTGYALISLQTLICLVVMNLPQFKWYYLWFPALLFIIGLFKCFNKDYITSSNKQRKKLTGKEYLYTDDNSFYLTKWVEKDLVD